MLQCFEMANFVPVVDYTSVITPVQMVFYMQKK
jgi:hypothetical protein